jgi:hypothetical protein
MLRGFQQTSVARQGAVFADVHRSSLAISVFDVAENVGIQLFCLPARCSHEVRPLVKSFFKSLKSYWSEEVDSY